MFGIKMMLRKAKKEFLWRRANPHNDTHIGEAYVNANLITVGKGTYGDLRVESTGSQGKLVIGSYCSIGRDVKFILNNEHPMDYISTFPLRALVAHDKNGEALSKGGIRVEDDVWIGSNAVILDGVTVGRGSVIAAGAVVVKDVPPYSIVGGCPAKLIRNRFGTEQIQLLSVIDFGKLKEQAIIDNIDLFYTPVDKLRVSDLEALMGERCDE